MKIEDEGMTSAVPEIVSPVGKIHISFLTDQARSLAEVGGNIFFNLLLFVMVLFKA